MEESVQFAQLDDIKLRYTISGQGEALVLLMGFCGNLEWWPQPVKDYFSAHYQLIQLDNRGTGKSERGTKPYTIATLADDVFLLLQELGLPKAHVLGVSMGGMIAQELAIRHPNCINRLLLINTQGTIKVHRSFSLSHLKFGWHYIRDKHLRKNPLLLNLIFSQAFRQQCSTEEWSMIHDAYSQSVSKERVQEQLRAIIHWRSIPHLKSIQIPTLVIAGTDDLLIPPKNSLELASQLPNARFVCLKNQGHGMLYEAFDQVIPYLEEFMSPKLEKKT